MKKLFTLFLATLAALSLTACGGSRGADHTAEPAHNETKAPTENTPTAKPSGKLTLEALMEHEPSPEDDFNCYDNGKGGCNIGGYLGDDTIIVIPEKIHSLTVQAVIGYVFTNIDEIEAVRFADSLTKIGDFVCTNCHGIKIIVLGRNVKSIGESAFQNCEALETIKLYEGLETIGRFAFVCCTSLKEIEIPESVTFIEHDAFSGCAEGFRIIGKSGSYAETYAKENNIEFIAK